MHYVNTKWLLLWIKVLIRLKEFIGLSYGECSIWALSLINVHVYATLSNKWLLCVYGLSSLWVQWIDSQHMKWRVIVCVEVSLLALHSPVVFRVPVCFVWPLSTVYVPHIYRLHLNSLMSRQLKKLWIPWMVDFVQQIYHTFFPVTKLCILASNWSTDIVLL